MAKMWEKVVYVDKLVECLEFPYTVGRNLDWYNHLENFHIID